MSVSGLNRFLQSLFRLATLVLYIVITNVCKDARVCRLINLVRDWCCHGSNVSSKIYDEKS